MDVARELGGRYAADLKARNTERIVDVVMERGSTHEQIAVDLTNDEQRREFARLLNTESPITLHTREFNFYQVFLKLTGEVQIKGLTTAAGL